MRLTETLSGQRYLDRVRELKSAGAHFEGVAVGDSNGQWVLTYYPRSPDQPRDHPGTRGSKTPEPEQGELWQGHAMIFSGATMADMSASLTTKSDQVQK